MKNPYKIYTSSSIETLSPPRITLLLLNTSLQYMEVARQKLSQTFSIKDYEIIHNNLTKAYDILCELQRSLNFDIDPQLARILYSNYNYANQQILQANYQKSPAPLNRSYPIIRTIRDAWQNMLNKQKWTPN